MSVAVRSPISFRLLGRSFLAFVLAPEPPLEDWFAGLDQSLERSLNFFVNRPIVLDLTKLAPSRAETEILMADLLSRHLRLIAVEGVDPTWLPAKLGPLPAGSQPVGMFEPPSTKPTATPQSPREGCEPAASLVIDRPVRSGECIVFPSGDITVVGSVASGAELAAGGSIHVYGTLRGRAIAGTNGEARARVFCSKFEAEFLVIDGLYKTADEIEPHLRGRPVQARLERDSMIVEALN